jgi:hypothetical protein
MKRALVTLALAAQGCLGSCGGDPVLAEKHTDQWRATLRCDVRRNVLGPPGAPTALGAARTPAHSARVLLTVESPSGGTARTIVTGGAMDDDDETKLKTFCQRLRGRIETADSAEGTVFAAALEGQRQSSVLLRARSGALYERLAGPVDGAPEVVARTHPGPITTTLAMISQGMLRDAAQSPALDALDPDAIRANRASLVEAARRCDAPAWVVERLARAWPDETADALFDVAFVRGRCSQVRDGLSAATPDLVTPRVRAWITDHPGAPWPQPLARYAREHGLSPAPEARDASAD